MDGFHKDQVRARADSLQDAPPEWQSRLRTLIEAFRTADEERARLRLALKKRTQVDPSEHGAGAIPPETIDALSLHLAILDPHGAIVAVNRAWRHFAVTNGLPDGRGCEGENYLAICDAATANDPHAGSAAAGIRGVISGEQEQFQMEYPCHSPAAQRWFLMQVSRFPDAGPARVAVTHLDVTRRKQAELALAEKQSLLDWIMSVLPHAIFWKDVNLRYLGCNAHFALDAGLDEPGQIIGRSDHDLSWTREQSNRSREEDRIVLETGEALMNIEATLRRPDGNTATVLVSKVPVQNGEQIVGVLGAYVDITNRKEAEHLQLERDASQSAVASMERVLGVVAHELRTPLAGLRATTECVLGYGAQDPATVRQWMQQIHQQVLHLSETVDSLLEAARLNSGRARWNWSVVSLAEICQEAIAAVQSLQEGREVQIELKAIPKHPSMNGDSDALRRLVLNLLNNALAHTQRGRIDVQVRMFNRADAIWVELVVADTGCGIPPEIQSRLGEAFALNSGVIGMNHIGGAGLGLSICKGIAAAHGGTIRIASEVGQGTTIRILMRADLGSPVLEAPGEIQFDSSERSAGEVK